MLTKKRCRWSSLHPHLFMTLAVVCGASLVAVTEANGQSIVPTGVTITPSAAPGASFQPLNPSLSFDPGFTVGQAVTTAVSPDGKTLLFLTSGYNSQNFTSGPLLCSRLSSSWVPSAYRPPTAWTHLIQ